MARGAQVFAVCARRDERFDAWGECLRREYEYLSPPGTLTFIPWPRRGEWCFDLWGQGKYTDEASRRYGYALEFESCRFECPCCFQARAVHGIWCGRDAREAGPALLS